MSVKQQPVSWKPKEMQSWQQKLLDNSYDLAKSFPVAQQSHSSRDTDFQLGGFW